MDAAHPIADKPSRSPRPGASSAARGRALPEPWVARLGLADDPFSDRRPPILATGPLRRAVNRIADDLTLGETHICVSGAGGIGKTSLVRALPRLLRDRPGIAGAASILDPAKSWAQHRESLTRQLDPPAGVLSPATLRLGIHGRSRWVVVIDDAERLEPNHVDHLENYVVLRGEGGRPLFTFVLVANVALHHGRNETVLERWLDPARVLHVPMAPLSSRELRGYLGARMRRVGWRGEAPFTPEAIARLHDLSGGLPGVVNRHARQLLAGVVRAGRREVTAEWIDATFAEKPLELAPARSGSAPASRCRIDLPIDPSGSPRSRRPTGPPGATVRERSRRRFAGRSGWLAVLLTAAAVATALVAGRVMVEPGATPGMAPVPVASPPPP